MYSFGAFNFFIYLLTMPGKKLYDDYDDQLGKRCTTCGEYQSLDEFYFNSKRNIYQSSCKTCCGEAQRKKFDLKFKSKHSEYWMIPKLPGVFKTSEDKLNTEAALRKMGWEYNILYRTWVKKGLKEIHLGKIIWLKSIIIETPRPFPKLTKREIYIHTIAGSTQRKVDRPDYETLSKQIQELGYKATGRLYGVSDNAIRKWLRFYILYEKN